ncbi:MAG: 50S ribosomal protein L9 [Coriobacteriia bacterium]|nr:50S ribosomal protein L9 [Coriobacteriia bacterium]
MKVILLQELKGRGAEGDVVDVARGFAVNYLFPRNVAIEATPGNLKQLESRMHNIRKRDEARVAEASDLATALDGKSVGIEAKVGEEGRLYGSITAQMIGDAILDQLGIELDRRRIETHGHIKELGAHPVEIAIYRDVKAHLVVNVVPEGAAPVAFAPEGEAVEVVEVLAEEVAIETPETEEAAVLEDVAEGEGENEDEGDELEEEGALDD